MDQVCRTRAPGSRFPHESPDRAEARAGSGWTHTVPALATHRGLTATVGDHLQNRVLLTGVNAGQVVKGGVHGPIGPFSELPGQVPALRFMDLPLENVGQDLRQGRDPIGQPRPWMASPGRL